MRREQILSSTHVDKHGMRMSKKALENAAEQINGPFVPGMGVEHDILIPPIGKFIKAYVKQLPDGEYGLFGEYLLFNPEDSREIMLPNGEKAMLDTWEDERPFTDRHKEIPSSIQISFDSVNFESDEEAQAFQQELEEEGSFEYQMMVRKSWIPDPELIIKLSEDAVKFLIAHKLLHTAGKKLVDDLSNDFSNLYTTIRNAAIKYARYCVPKNRPITYLIVVPGTPAIEFVIRTTNPEKISEAINSIRFTALEEAEQLHNSFGAQKIQFLLKEDGNWGFNYLLTNSGKVVGTQDAISRREKAVEIVYQQHLNK
ncbi:hypothetical protein BG616_16205 [Bacillus subtilis]|nr:hypothetical protein BG616_16205 [Bacillus subtilis]